MGDLYGIDSSTYRSLPSQDQQAIREQYRAEQAPVDSPPATPEAPDIAPAEPITFASAETTAEAVEAIHAIDLPSSDDLPSGLGEPVRQAIYGGRVEAFNERRAAQAQAALDRLEPQRSDFDSLNGATASYEHSEAMTAFNNNPYTQQLRRIVEESTANPTQVPGYLLTADTPTTDATRLDITQVRTALGALGIDLPADASPSQVQAGYDILATAPDGILAWAINPGQQVSFQTPVAGVATLPLPVRGGANITVVGQVEMSGVQTDMDFTQTQTFEMQVELQGTLTAAIGKTPLNRMYAWAERLDAFPGARQMIEQSPLLRNIFKGLPIPISGSYTEFAGSRVTYEAVVTPEQGARISDGDLAAVPNPLDPMSMPIGTGTLMRGQTLTGSHFEANYKLLHVTGTHVELEGQGFGVRRVDANTFEIVAGDVETVENALFVGLGYRGVAAIGLTADNSSETRDLSIARIDLRTEEGQAAYQAFMSSGQMPAWSPPGVLQTGTTQVYDAEHATRFGIEVGGFGWGTELNSSETNLVSTSWADGTTDYTNSVRMGDNHLAEWSWQTDASGVEIPGSARYGMMLSSYDPALASYMTDAYSSDPLNSSSYGDFDGNQNVRLEFSEADLMQIQADAREAFLANDPQGFNQDLLDQIEAGTAASNDLQVQLALAQTPAEVYRLVGNDFFQQEVAVLFAVMYADLGRPAPGTLMVRDAG